MMFSSVLFLYFLWYLFYDLWVLSRKCWRAALLTCVWMQLLSVEGDCLYRCSQHRPCQSVSPVAMLTITGGKKTDWRCTWSAFNGPNTLKTRTLAPLAHQITTSASAGRVYLALERLLCKRAWKATFLPVVAWRLFKTVRDARNILTVWFVNAILKNHEIRKSSAVRTNKGGGPCSDISIQILFSCILNVCQ